MPDTRSNASCLAISVVIFVVALIARLWMLPAEDELAFLTFYPAVIAVFYFCGFRWGVGVTLLSAFAGSYIFLAPQYTLDVNRNGWISVAFFIATSIANGLLVRHTHKAVMRWHEAHWELHAQKTAFEGILNDQTELICRFKATGEVNYVNDAFCRFFGVSREDLLGQGWAPVVSPEDLEYVRQEVSKLSKAKPVVSIENRVIAAHKQVKWGHFVNRALFGDDGQIEYIQSVGRDITDRKDLEQQLKLNADLVLDLYNHAPCGYLSLDTQGRFVMVNDTALKWFGSSRETLIGKLSPAVFMNPADAALFPDRLARLFQEGVLNDVEFDIIATDQEPRRISLRQR